MPSKSPEPGSEVYWTVTILHNINLRARLNAKVLEVNGDRAMIAVDENQTPESPKHFIEVDVSELEVKEFNHGIYDTIRRPF